MAKGVVYKGIGISNGKISGRIHFFDSEIKEEKIDTTVNRKEELEKLDKAREKAIKEIKSLENKARKTLGEEEAQIFEIHAMLLDDEDYVGTIIAEVNSGKSAIQAVKAASVSYSEMLKSLGDEYLSARCADIIDISNQLIGVLSGEVWINNENLNEPYILVARDLTPSETVKLDQTKILGFVTFGGTPSSHTGILARSMGIPALVGVGQIDRIYEGEFALLNAEKGELTVLPDESEIEKFEKERISYNKIAKEHEIYLRSVMNKPAVTRSGHRIMIYANIGNENEVSSAIANGAEGIGLLRSEFLYLQEKDYPKEETLFSAYRDVAIKMQGKRVIIRTLDIGADKQIPYFDLPKEENPALGYRALRICLDRKELFKTQLRAILRSSHYGRVAIMFPMVVGVEEIKAAKNILEECKRELLTQGVPFDRKVEVGIMIETPSSAIMSDVLAKEVDFFSVGTNDLTQYTLAIDRQNTLVSHIGAENTEPVLRLIKIASEAIHAEGGWIGICGEMAADLSLTQEFADMRIDELSVSIPYLLGVRGKVSECK